MAAEVGGDSRSPQPFALKFWHNYCSSGGGWGCRVLFGFLLKVPDEFLLLLIDLPLRFFSSFTDDAGPGRSIGISGSRRVHPQDGSQLPGHPPPPSTPPQKMKRGGAGGGLHC